MPSRSPPHPPPLEPVLGVAVSDVRDIAAALDRDLVWHGRGKGRRHEFLQRCRGQGMARTPIPRPPPGLSYDPAPIPCAGGAAPAASGGSMPGATTAALTAGATAAGYPAASSSSSSSSGGAVLNSVNTPAACAAMLGGGGATALYTIHENATRSDDMSPRWPTWAEVCMENMRQQHLQREREIASARYFSRHARRQPRPRQTRDQQPMQPGPDAGAGT